jgi:hypothetical protein
MMPVVTSSCDPEIEHVIFNCEEITHVYEDVYTRIIPIKKDGCEGTLIGVHACDDVGRLIKGGLLVVLENGIWVRQPMDVDRFGHVFDFDTKRRIKVLK